MSKTFTHLELGTQEVPGESDYPVYCTGCHYHCLLYYLAKQDPLPEEVRLNDDQIIHIGIPKDCPVLDD